MSFGLGQFISHLCAQDKATHGWFCTRERGHSGPCAAIPVKGPGTRPQSRWASMVEAVVNTLLGLLIAYFATWGLFKLYHVAASQGQMWSIVMWMTLISVVRSYFVRRMWNSEFWKRLSRRRK